jgi:hypothetical protein
MSRKGGNRAENAAEYEHPGDLRGRNHHAAAALKARKELAMGRYVLLWLLGVPIPILLLIWMFGGLN